MLAPGRPEFVVDETAFALRMNVLEVLKEPVKMSAPINVTVETRLSALAKSRCIK
jgi:hypothetical protein